MSWLRKHKKEAHDAEDKREQQDRAAEAAKTRDETKDDAYKPPPEQDVLGWGHYHDYPPD
ncbi:hypothetical protein ABZ543_33845 [Streptomyces roseifaciens]